jgi:ferredoxin
MRVIVDEEKCIGSGQCVQLAPEVFDQRDDDGIVILLVPEPPEHLDNAVREAAAMCPSGAINVSGER